MTSQSNAWRGCMRRCPACNLPTRASAIGLAFPAESNDQSRRGVVCVCLRCEASAKRLPPHVRFKMLDRAADRALADPSRYLCAAFPTIEAARLTAALLGHPQHALEALKAIGWYQSTDHAI